MNNSLPIGIYFTREELAAIVNALQGTSSIIVDSETPLAKAFFKCRQANNPNSISQEERDKFWANSVANTQAAMKALLDSLEENDEPKVIAICPQCKNLIFPNFKTTTGHHLNGEEQDVDFTECPSCGYGECGDDNSSWQIEDSFCLLEEKDIWIEFGRPITNEQKTMNATTRLAEIKAELEGINIELAEVRRQTKESSRKEWKLVGRIIDLTEEQSHLESKLPQKQ